MTLPPELVEPGTVDLGPFLIFILDLNLTPPVTFGFFGLMMNGTITFTQAGTTTGDPIVGSFSGDVGIQVPLP
jgi:hypothetical protein